MKKTYVNPDFSVIEISELPDTVSTSNRIPIVTDTSDFGGYHPF